MRAKSEKFIYPLKEEMLENQSCDVQSLLCVIRLKDEDFDEKLKEGYMYKTICGNNSREVILQLLRK